MGTVLELRLRVANDWTGFERSQLEALVEQLPTRAARDLAFSVTDDGDPWCAILDDSSDVILHVARISGRFFVHAIFENIVAEARDLPTAVARFTSDALDLRRPSNVTPLFSSGHLAPHLFVAAEDSANLARDDHGWGGSERHAVADPPPAALQTPIAALPSELVAASRPGPVEAAPAMHGVEPAESGAVQPGGDESAAPARPPQLTIASASFEPASPDTASPHALPHTVLTPQPAEPLVALRPDSLSAGAPTGLPSPPTPSVGHEGPADLKLMAESAGGSGDLFAVGPLSGSVTRGGASVVVDFFTPGASGQGPTTSGVMILNLPPQPTAPAVHDFTRAATMEDIQHPAMMFDIDHHLAILSQLAGVPLATEMF